MIERCILLLFSVKFWMHFDFFLAVSETFLKVQYIFWVSPRNTFPALCEFFRSTKTFPTLNCQKPPRWYPDKDMLKNFRWSGFWNGRVFKGTIIMLTSLFWLRCCGLVRGCGLVTILLMDFRKFGNLNFSKILKETNWIKSGGKHTWDKHWWFPQIS
jgi:hypothetical protein